MGTSHCTNVQATPRFNRLGTVPVTNNKLWNLKKRKYISQLKFGMNIELSRVLILGVEW